MLYKVKATDEFGRYFEMNAKIEAGYLIFKEQADSLYSQMMSALISPILHRMGTDAYGEWSVEVDEEEV